MRTIDHIIIHCSATCEGASLTLGGLEEAHRRRGIRGIGYHYYIRRDGTTLRTRPLELVGVHVKGHDAHSVGICYEGGLDGRGHPEDTRTPEQRSALRLLVHQLLRRFKGNVRVCGHRDLTLCPDGGGVAEPGEWLKECPCFDVASAL